MQNGTGGPTAVVDMSAYEVPAFGVDRAWGQDRYETACAAWRRIKHEAEWVVLATGEAFPDALSASAPAGACRGPLLLTRRGSLPACTKQYIRDLRARGVHIVGGMGAVGPAAESELISMGFDVHRISGADRYATSVAQSDRYFHGVFDDMVVC